MRRGALTLLVLLAACREPVITEPQTLGGALVLAEVLEQGRLVYRRYCVSCHGEKGDGKGVASFGQVPAPRDFRHGKFKFAGVEDLGLPSDVELQRIITQGLAGTYMRPWVLQETELNAVVQYIKTFSLPGKGFRSKRLKVKAPQFPPDPYASAEQKTAAIKKGEELYHALFRCSACHPAYVGAAKMKSWGAQMRTDAPFAPVPKWSEDFRSVLVPPDFFRHAVRAVRAERDRGKLSYRVDDLYRTIAYGMQGPMPGYAHLGDAEVWAVAYYVKSLLDSRESDEAKTRLQNLSAAH